MKVGLLLYGLPRFIDDPRPAEFYKNNIISKYDTDVYAHCWFEPSHLEKKSPWTGTSHYLKTTSTQPDTHPIPENSPQLISEYYNPVQLKVESPREFTFEGGCKEILNSKFTGKNNFFNERGYSNILSQYKSIQEVTNMVLTSGKQYDIFVMGRYDITVNKFPDNLSSLDKEKFYTQDCNEFPDGIHIYSNKYLNWFNELFTESNNPSVCKQFERPSSEMIKKTWFGHKFDMGNHCKYPMRINILRK